VKIINTDGMALIGPGSEWFWTAVSGIVLAVTFIAIYRQLRLQRSQGAIDQIAAFTREWDSERFLSYRLAVVVALKGGAYPAGVPGAAAVTLGNYWEGIGALVRAGHLDRKLLWDSNGNACQLWWEYLGPYFQSTRARLGDPAILENFEWLARQMSSMDRRAGLVVAYGGARLPAALDDIIGNTRERLRVERSLSRTVVTGL
jgi:hypothetical protein